MLSEHWEQIEAAGFYFFIAAIFFLIGMAIHDVLKSGKVPRFGRIIVWTVLFAGCAGFIAKGLVEVLWTSGGVG